MSGVSVQFMPQEVSKITGASTIADTIKLQAALHPKQPAIITSGIAPLSFQDLGDHIKKIGEQLHAAGIGSSSRVGIALPKGPEAVIFGVSIAAHAISVPINPQLTPAERDEELARLRLDAIVLPNWIDSPFSSAVKYHSLGIFHAAHVIDSFSNITLHQVHDVPYPLRRPEIPSSDSTALVLRTSGTTGAPKYIRVTHANLLSLARKLQGWFNLSSDDRSASMTPAYYAGGIKVSILSSLLLGGGVTIPSKSHPENLAEWISDLRPTWFYVNPTLAQAILDNLRSEPLTAPGHSLRFVAVGSGLLSDAVRINLESILQVPVLEMYGLSEAGVMAANPAPPAIYKPGTVGLISPGEVAIRDYSGDLRDAGEVGEIVVRGPSVSPGYLDDKTPSEGGEDRWLPTGDLGIIDKDGFLTIAGRIKDVINRGGEKIAPYEIEKALLLHPAIQEAVVFGVPHPRLIENVSAAVILKPDAVATSSELQRFLYDTLAPFKVPQRIHIVSTLPRTTTNKIQRSAIRDYFSNPTRRILPPDRSLEMAIVEIWKLLLVRTDIGIDDNFFEMGGDSLLATQMVLEVETLTRRKIPQSALRAVWTVRQLAVAALDDQPAEHELITFAKNGTGAPFFFCHGDYNDRGVYALRLADLIEQDFPIMLVNPYPGLDPANQGPIEEIARSYLPHLLAAQPTGKFRIGGYCYGSFLAWEIACQLGRAGREIEFIVLVDTPSLNGRIALRATKKVLNLIARFSPNAMRKKIRRDGMGIVWAWVRRFGVGDRPIVWRLIRKLYRDVFRKQSSSVMPDFIAATDPPWRALYGPLSNYIPPSLDTELFCLVSEESAKRMDFSPLAWTNLTRVLHHKLIPGGHNTCITTFSGELANELNKILSASHADSVKA